MPPFARFQIFKNVQHMGFDKIWIFEQLPKSKIPPLAIPKIISHIWEEGSQQVNNDKPDFRFCSRKLWTFYQSSRSKTLFFGLRPKGARFHFFSEQKTTYFWKPSTCGYVAAGAFLPQKKGPIFLEALDLWVRCRRRFFFSPNFGST